MPKNTDIKNKINIATYGIGTDLDKDSRVLSDIVKQTSLEVASKFGKRLEGRVIDSYTNMNLSNLFMPNNSNTNTKSALKQQEEQIQNFKDMMQDTSASAIQMMAGEQSRIINYANYKAIVDNIPEMAMCLDTYISNILSPDDYSKSVFAIDYNSTNKTEEKKVKQNLSKLMDKYQIEDKCEEIVEKTLTYGDCFVSILPYDREIAKYLAQTSASNMLNETADPVFQRLDEQLHLTERMYAETLDESYLASTITIDEREALNEAFGDGFDADKLLTDTINNKIKIRSVTDLLRNRAEADNDVLFNKPDFEVKKEKDKKKKGKFDALNINGADIKILDPDKVICLNVDGINYGYYYIEPGFEGEQDRPYSASNPRAAAQASNPLNPTIQPQMNADPNNYASIPAARNLNISDEKLSLISNVLLKGLSKKLNKKYINDNKQFKDLLFNLLKQKYIFEKGVSIVYFLPEDIVHFEAHSIYERIVYFAKLYIAVLTNTVIIKMGRGHDKRIYYVAVGVDQNQEQAILKTVQDVKTKEFKMSNLGSISSILQLNPGAFDDYYMPMINGEKPVDIETLAGMDANLQDEFLEYCRKSMVQGTGVPAAIMEATDNIEFARQIAAQNANFCRRIVRYQKQLTKPFKQLVQTLYSYEYKYSIDDSNMLDTVDINQISISFPSPAALNLSNLAETFTQVDSVAGYMAKTYIPDTADQSNTDAQEALRQKIIRKMMVQVGWEDMDSLYEEFKTEYQHDQLIKSASTPPEDDGLGGQDGGYGNY